MESKRYVFFDLDGTLTDPAEGITNSVMHALRHFGIEVTDRRELYPFIGPPLSDSYA
jgi:phosphoglycolate phosphatase